MLAPDAPDDARHRIGVARAVERGARVVDVDALERGGEAVGVALAPDLAVGDDVEAGLLLRRGWRGSVASSCASARNASGHAPQLASRAPAAGSGRRALPGR